MLFLAVSFARFLADEKETAELVSAIRETFLVDRAGKTLVTFVRKETKICEFLVGMCESAVPFDIGAVLVPHLVAEKT